MVSGGLLALVDDLATILDDVSVMAKLAVKKTAGVAGDDLAVGAQQVVGLDPSRELPIVWAVAKGSLVNKCWLVPSALALSVFAPGVITPVMMLGGAFLCYEGVHKVVEKLGPKRDAAASREELAAAAGAGAETLLALERAKIKEAIRTDTILSAEIVVIALGAVSDASLGMRALTLSLVALFMTAAIYGLIAVIVKADDAGLHLLRREGEGAGARAQRALGRGLLAAMPRFMKGLGFVGTLAMFLVGGGIVVHGITPMEHAIQGAVRASGALGGVVEQVLVLAVGVLVGVAALPVAKLVERVMKRGG